MFILGLAASVLVSGGAWRMGRNVYSGVGGPIIFVLVVGLALPARPFWSYLFRKFPIRGRVETQFGARHKQGANLLAAWFSLVLSPTCYALSFFRLLQGQPRDFVVRVDRETWVIHPTYTGPMDKLTSRPGMHKRWLSGALYGRDEQVPINLLVVWQRGYREPWLLATTLDDPQQVLALYRSRMKIEHGFRDWKTHLRLKGTLRAQNIAYVRGLMLVLALLYWFICLCGLRWNHPRFRSRVACWGAQSFFKTALDLLITHDPLVLAAWPTILAWLHDKLKFFQPCPRPYALRYRRNRPRYLQTG